MRTTRMLVVFGSLTLFAGTSFAGKGGRNIRDGRGTQEGIDDAVSVISRDDGKFDVTCKDGTK
ncbi:MAG: hypothetical protein RIQ81_2167, partial [Pseudomonadota bacterium]